VADRGPPPGDATELWLKLTQLPRPFKELDHPRKDPVTHVSIGKLAIVPLTERELNEARAAAEAYTKKTLKEERSNQESIGYQQIYRDSCYVEYISRACRSTADMRIPAFPSAEQARQWLFPDEIAVIMEACTIWQTETGPIVSRMTEEEMEAWLSKLAEGASRVPLALLSSEMKNELLLFLAKKFSTVSGSAGSQPDAASSSPASDSETTPSGPAYPEPPPDNPGA
jgi:hypothetical protein